jgi:tRNA pseudouridine38-40 synthase
VERALVKIGWQGKSVLFAGRTDAGVHAEGQVIAFDLDWGHAEEELNKALNAELPKDISADQVRRTRQNFHPRYDALSRTYQYRILTRPIRVPLMERYCWRVWPEVDVRRIKKESRHLIGSHNFAALGKAHQPGGSTFREISRAAWKKNGTELVFEISGNAFLYHMVRNIVMTLVKIGQGLEPAGRIKELLDNPAESKAQGLAPARGLSLLDVKY